MSSSSGKVRPVSAVVFAWAFNSEAPRNVAESSQADQLYDNHLRVVSLLKRSLHSHSTEVLKFVWKVMHTGQLRQLPPVTDMREITVPTKSRRSLVPA
jgi:predicted esterase YcpF (UPF0227 family)